MIDQQATIVAVRKIGEGLIALSAALAGENADDGNIATKNDKEQAVKTVSSFRCPNCKGEMVLRTARATGELFAGCRNYPDCKGTRNLEGVPGNTKKKSTGPVALDMEDDAPPS